MFALTITKRKKKKRGESSKRGHTNEKVRKILEASNKFVDTIRDISTVVLYFCLFF